MRSLLIIVSFFLLLRAQSFGQNLAQLKHERDSIYNENIMKTRLFGVYIPKDLDDAFNQLDKLSSEESKSKYKSADEATVAKKLHFGLGRWMAYNWNFDEGSRFSHYLSKLGLSGTDDMIDFMLVSYHRHLTNRSQEVENRIKVYQKRAIEKKYKEGTKGEILHTETKSIPRKD